MNKYIVAVTVTVHSGRGYDQVSRCSSPRASHCIRNPLLKPPQNISQLWSQPWVILGQGFHCYVVHHRAVTWFLEVVPLSLCVLIYMVYYTTLTRFIKLVYMVYYSAFACFITVYLYGSLQCIYIVHCS